MQIYQKNSISVNIWLYSFLQRSFIYFHICRLFTQMIKGTSYNIRWRSDEIFFFLKHEVEEKKSLFSYAHRCRKAQERESLCSVIIRCCHHRRLSQSSFVIITIRCNHRPPQFCLMSINSHLTSVTIHLSYVRHPTFIIVPSDIRHCPFQLCLTSDIHHSSVRHPSLSISVMSDIWHSS